MLLSDQLCHPKEDPISVVNSLLMYKDSNCRGGSDHSLWLTRLISNVDPEWKGLTKKEFLSYIHVSIVDGKFF